MDVGMYADAQHLLLSIKVTRNGRSTDCNMLLLLPFNQSTDQSNQSIHSAMPPLSQAGLAIQSQQNIVTSSSAIADRLHCRVG